VFRCSADTHFNAKIADRDLRRYREKGPGVTTRLLRDLIVDAGEAKGDLLDIGCGVGALTFELLERGMDRAVGIDASRAHLAVASSEADRRGRLASVRLVESDFVEVAATLPAARVVALDRVVCCYPSFAPLLEASARHAKRCLAISYPRDVWYMHGAMGLDNGLRRIRGKSFRTFVHPADRMVAIVEQHGFSLAGRRRTPVWSADVFVRHTTT
jgi:SAM-dependent methyltransferase